MKCTYTRVLPFDNHIDLVIGFWLATDAIAVSAAAVSITLAPALAISSGGKSANEMTIGLLVGKAGVGRYGQEGNGERGGARKGCKLHVDWL